MLDTKPSLNFNVWKNLFKQILKKVFSKCVLKSSYTPGTHQHLSFFSRNLKRDVAYCTLKGLSHVMDLAFDDIFRPT
jgi:hypothetical protein